MEATRFFAGTIIFFSVFSAQAQDKPQSFIPSSELAYILGAPLAMGALFGSAVLYNHFCDDHDSDRDTIRDAQSRPADLDERCQVILRNALEVSPKGGFMYQGKQIHVQRSYFLQRHGVKNYRPTIFESKKDILITLPQAGDDTSPERAVFERVGLYLAIEKLKQQKTAAHKTILRRKNRLNGLFAMNVISGLSWLAHCVHGLGGALSDDGNNNHAAYYGLKAGICLFLGLPLTFEVHKHLDSTEYEVDVAIEKEEDLAWQRAESEVFKNAHKASWNDMQIFAQNLHRDQEKQRRKIVSYFDKRRPSSLARATLNTNITTPLHTVALQKALFEANCGNYSLLIKGGKL